VPRTGSIGASQQLGMGKRRTTSRAVADLAPLARAPVPACAARSDRRNDDSVLLSRHRRLLSEPLMRGRRLQRTRLIRCPLLSIEAPSLAMATREDRAMTNVSCGLLWQKQVIDKHQQAGTAA
jgi:hypothetical protein